MKIRVYEDELLDFLYSLAGNSGKDADSLFQYMVSQRMIRTYDHVELVHNFVEPDTGKSSEVSLFVGDPAGLEDWTIVDIRSKTNLMGYLQGVVESEGLELPSGSTELITIRGLREVPYREVNVTLTKLPSIYGFTSNPEEITYIIERLEQENEYITSVDTNDIVNFIIRREDNLSHFYLTFGGVHDQITVLTPQELAATIEELLEMYERKYPTK